MNEFTYSNQPHVRWFHWYMWLLPLIFSGAAFEGYETMKFFWLVGGAGILAWLRLREQGRPFSFRLGLHGLLLIATGWALLAGLVGLDPVNSLVGYYPRYSHSVLLYGIIAFIAFYAGTELQPGDIVKLIRGWVWVALVVALTAIVQSFGIMTYEVSNGGPIHPPGLLGNANFTALFLAALVPFTVLSALHERRFAAQVGRWVALVAMLWALVVLDSRGAFVGLAFTAVALLAASYKKLVSAKIALATLGAIVAVVGIWAFTSVKFSTLVHVGDSLSKEANLQNRVLVWGITAEAASRAPWMGYGPGNFQNVFSQFRTASLVGESNFFDDPHNFYFSLLMSGGWVMLLLWLLWMVVPLVKFWTSQNQTLSPEWAMWRTFTWAGLVGCMAMVAFQPMPIVAYCILAILVAMLTVNEPWAQVVYAPTFKPFRGVLRGAAYACAAVLVVFGIAGVVAEHSYFSGLNNYNEKTNSFGIRKLSLAARLNPWVPVYSLYALGAEAKTGTAPEKVIRHVEVFEKTHARTPLSLRMMGDVYLVLFQQHPQNTDFRDKALAYYVLSAQADMYNTDMLGRVALLGYRFNRFDVAETYAKYYLSLKANYASGWIVLARTYQAKSNAALTLKFMEYAGHIQKGNVKLQRLIYQMRTEGPLNVPIDINTQRQALE